MVLRFGAPHIVGMFLTLPPAPPLASIVHSYWFVEDIPGQHQGRPIRTSPIPAAVLSVNVGRPNAAEDGSLVPDVSLLGLQSRPRSWQSWSNTYFVMAMLTIAGLVRLFPGTGAGGANRLLDLGAITGDAQASALSRWVGAALEPARVAAELDRWLIQKLASSEPVPESARLSRAHDVLRSGGSVATAAEAADTDRRQLQRWCHRHFGVGPKELADLERLQRSLRSAQTGNDDSVSGFSDQPHQIRNWRRRLGITPGAYQDDAPSPMAAYFSSNTVAAEPAFYL